MLEYDARTLTFDTFCAQCLRGGRPAIVRHATDALAASRLRERLEPVALLRTLGAAHRVPVYTVANTAATAHDTRTRGDEHEDEGECRMCTLGEVCARWAAHTPDAPRLWYLKDWHMQLDVEEAARRVPAMTHRDDDGGDDDDDGAAVAASVTCTQSPPQQQPSSSSSSDEALYRVPSFLGADWLQPFCAHTRARARACGFGDGRSDYRFAYIGVVHTWTPLHYDVFGSYSWSYNVCGRKLWYFASARGNALLHATLPPHFPTPPDMRVLTGLDELLTCVQEEGDLVFVPSCCYHQVHNIAGARMRVPVTTAAAAASTLSSTSTCDADADDASNVVEVELTVAINHNWCNQFCLERMVQLLLAEAAALRRWVSVDEVAAAFALSDDNDNNNKSSSSSTDDDDDGCDDDKRTRSARHDKNDAVARRYDAMLQQSCNWSCTSMQHFLRFVLQQHEEKEREREQRRQQLLTTMACAPDDGAAAHATPADGWPSVRAQLTALLERVACAY